MSDMACPDVAFDFALPLSVSQLLSLSIARYGIVTCGRDMSGHVGTCRDEGFKTESAGAILAVHERQPQSVDLSSCARSLVYHSWSSSEMELC